MKHYDFHNLIFEGGGVKGVAYIGALEVLEEKGILPQIDRVGGTSAGAITALLLGLGYSTKGIRKIVMKMDFEQFLDDSGLMTNVFKLIRKFGINSGDGFMKWAQKAIKAKTGNPNATFRDLHMMADDKGFRDLYFIGTNMSTKYSEVFSYAHTPDMRVAEAVRISMSIPYFFTAIKRPNQDLYVDGGLMNNYPIQLFDKQKYISGGPSNGSNTFLYNHQSLGFKLASSEEISVFENHGDCEHKPVGNIMTFSRLFIETLLNVQNNTYLSSRDWDRTIYIDTLNVGTTDFNITEETKNALVQSGRTHMTNYFNWYDNQNNAPENRLD